MGELAEGASVMVYGDAGAGKTTNMIALARGLCKAGVKTLYVSFEQFETDGLKQALKRAGGACPGLFFAGKAEKTAGYGCVVIDSTSAAGWGIDELRGFLKANKGKLIFYIVQSTKDGNFRGGNDLKHEADTVLKITASKLFTEKNRFGALAETRNPFAGKALEGLDGDSKKIAAGIRAIDRELAVWAKRRLSVAESLTSRDMKKMAAKLLDDIDDKVKMLEAEKSELIRKLLN